MGRYDMHRTPTGIRGPRGFTLLELMLVVTVLAIIVAIALPSFLQSRMAANEASAIVSMKSMITANEQYRVRFSTYAGSIANLNGAGYLDDSLLDSQKAGYTFSYTTGVGTYSFNGDPTSPGVSGTRYFFVDTSGVIRFSTTGTATSSDSAIGN